MSSFGILNVNKEGTGDLIVCPILCKKDKPLIFGCPPMVTITLLALIIGASLKVKLNPSILGLMLVN